VLLGLVGLGLWHVADDTRVLTPPSPSTAPSGVATSPGPVRSRPSEAAELLRALADALEGGSRADVVGLASGGHESARRELAALHANVRRLGMMDLGMRYVDADAGRVSAADRRALGPDAFVSDVALSWRLEGFDDTAGDMEVTLTLVDEDERVAFGSARGDYGRAAPLWMLERLAVFRSRRVLVATADRSALGRYVTLARRAARDVRAVLPGWRDGFAVQVPRASEQLHRVLDADPGTYDSIAAVTATADGSLRSTAPAQILVNPEVFDGLGRRGAQIVMSHEATHVAMDAATSTMPLWLLEGFADYVALARSDLPVSVTASQILAEVRRNGPPVRLPGRGEFDPENKILGTSYEAAWLACRLIGEEYGERRLVRLYRAVDRGQSLDQAFAGLGTTERAFTRAWGAYLRELAG
jgi:hypothetical protein